MVSAAPVQGSGTETHTAPWWRRYLSGILPVGKFTDLLGRGVVHSSLIPGLARDAAPLIPGLARDAGSGHEHSSLIPGLARDAGISKRGY